MSKGSMFKSSRSDSKGNFHVSGIPETWELILDHRRIFEIDHDISL
jgi:hypothetical protein